MGAPLSNYLFLFAVLQFVVQLSLAAETCRTSRRTTFTCLNRPHQSAYCCGTYSFPACCYRTTFYSLWYFWFAIVLFFVILSSCIAGFKRRQNRLRLQQVPARSTVITTTTTTQQQLPVASPINQQVGPAIKSDLPPSYDQIQQQGGIHSKPSQPLQPAGGLAYPPQNYNTIYSSPPSANDPPVPPYPGS